MRQTKVGDRYVLEAMRVGGYTLGGEQSGHVIMSEHATTGDGILTALHVLERMAATGRSLADLASVVTRLPAGARQRARRRQGRAPTTTRCSPRPWPRRRPRWADSGRVLLRPSGTEALVRVMVEAPTDETARDVADRLADVVRERLSLS